MAEVVINDICFTYDEDAVANLPETLSGLLRLSVQDTKQCEGMPDRTLDMPVWFYKRDDHCVLCMAGAVMDRTLMLRTSAQVVSLSAVDFGLRTRCNRLASKLVAIDSLRQGSFDRNMKTVASWRGGITEEQLEALRGACKFIREKYNHGIGRAAWEVYLEVADALDYVDL